jgi:hypothetical protein
MDPLLDFARWGKDAPYVSERNSMFPRTRVVAVRPKTPYVAARLGGLAHLHDGVAVVFSRNVARFGARYLCGPGSCDVALLPNIDAYGGVCAQCEDFAKGPCLYRCFNDAGALIYIGSTPRYLKRLQGHRTRTPWWDEVAETTDERYPTIFEARAAERLAIIAERPLRNRQYNRRTA